MTSPVTQSPAIQITFVVTSDQVNAVVEQLKSALPPKNAQIEETSKETIAANTQELKKSRLALFLEKLVNAAEKVPKFIAYPTLILGIALLAFGLGHTLFVFATTLSVTLLMESQALVTLLLGGMLYKLSQDLIQEKDINTTMGNLAYVPLPYLAKLAK